MKIAFIGTHGTGKTTLCYDLAAFLKKQGQDVEIVSEMSREAVKIGLPINEETTQETQIWLLNSQINAEIEAQQRTKLIVCDRSVIDNYIYLLHKFGRQKAYESYIEAYTKINPYNFLFKVPITEEPSHDGVRATDPVFQKLIDQKLEAFLIEKGIKYFSLPNGSRRNWMDFIVGKIQAARIDRFIVFEGHQNTR